jgi:chorismate synthase
MALAYSKVREEGDSVGGAVECAVIGLPAGLGEPMFDGLENRIAPQSLPFPP